MVNITVHLRHGDVAKTLGKAHLDVTLAGIGTTFTVRLPAQAGSNSNSTPNDGTR